MVVLCDFSAARSEFYFILQAKVHLHREVQAGTMESEESGTSDSENTVRRNNATNNLLPNSSDLRWEQLTTAPRRRLSQFSAAGAGRRSSLSSLLPVKPTELPSKTLSSSLTHGQKFSAESVSGGHQKSKISPPSMPSARKKLNIRKSPFAKPLGVKEVNTEAYEFFAQLEN